MQYSWAAAWLYAIGVVAAQSGGVPLEQATLGRIRARMAETLARQPNYTCVQQIERSSRRAPRHKYQLRDMLRLEVALVDGKEMYAWPGESKFEDRDLLDMVPGGGAIGTGDFATHARAVFLTGAPKFEYDGIVEIGGRRAYCYRYKVAQLESGYHIRVNGAEAVVGYHGSFCADVNTLDLIRLEVVADDIPTYLGLRSAQDVMEYGRVQIGSSDFLLPVSSELAMVDLNGNASRNITHFSGCRQYTGESVLTFADAPESAPAEVAAVEQPKEPVSVPPDMVFEVSLDGAIDSEKSMVGDPLTATLQENIKLKRRVLFPKGAKLLGRILRLERHGDHCDVDIQFSEVASENVRSSLATRLEPRMMPDSHSFLRGLVQMSDEPMASGLKLRGPRVHLPRGFRLRLRTVAVNHSANNVSMSR
jgi:hypothetical protein